MLRDGERSRVGHSLTAQRLSHEAVKQLSSG